MRKLRFALLGATSLVVLSGGVEAADLPAAPPPPLAPAFVPQPEAVWTGFYIGVHAGHAWVDNAADDDFFDIDIDADGQTDGYSAYLAGGQVGYNHQFGNVVIGLEADLAWTNLDEEFSFDATFPGGAGTGNIKLESDWLATIRGRAGYAFDRFLLYATGGAAFTNLSVSYNGPFTVGGAGANGSETISGWTVGAGVEGMITPNLTARLEYLYVNFEDAGVRFKGDDVTFSPDVDAHILRGGLNYKFNW